MEILVSIVRRFDVVAVQEVRSTDPTVVPKFMEMINAEGARYDFIIGPGLGPNFQQGTVRLHSQHRPHGGGPGVGLHSR